MLELGHDDISVLTLGEVRQFFNEDCLSLPDSTPIMLNAAIEHEPVVPCIQILADKESIEFYNF